MHVEPSSNAQPALKRVLDSLPPDQATVNQTMYGPVTLVVLVVLVVLIVLVVLVIFVTLVVLIILVVLVILVAIASPNASFRLRLERWPIFVA